MKTAGRRIRNFIISIKRKNPKIFRNNFPERGTMNIARGFTVRSFNL